MTIRADYLNDLPTEIAEKVLSHLSETDLVRVSRVNKKLHHDAQYGLESAGIALTERPRYISFIKYYRNYPTYNYAKLLKTLQETLDKIDRTGNAKLSVNIYPYTRNGNSSSINAQLTHFLPGLYSWLPYKTLSFNAILKEPSAIEKSCFRSNSSMSCNNRKATLKITSSLNDNITKKLKDILSNKEHELLFKENDPLKVSTETKVTAIACIAAAVIIYYYILPLVFDFATQGAYNSK